MSFSVSPGGFNSQFNGDMTGWVIHTGQWWIASSAWLTTQGLTNAWASVSFNDTFSNLDYKVKLWRGGSETIANSILIRGTPAPLSSTGLWDSYYAFQYTRDGRYSVWKRVEGVSSYLQSWTTTTAINQGDAWNELRVVANGSTLDFYINGTLVWTGTDSSLSSGRVGIRMYKETSAAEQLWVDWAILTEGAPDVTDTISDEQMVLNEEANKNKTGTEQNSN
jgi:hypothetical protein